MSSKWLADGPVGRALFKSLGRMTAETRRVVVESPVLLCEAAVSEVWHDPAMYPATTDPPSRSLETQLYESTGAGWWADDFRPSIQVRIATGETPPTRWRTVSNWSDIYRMPKPAGGVWTSSLIDESTSAWSLTGEARSGRMWKPIVDGGELVVWELKRPDDWASLCRTYPLYADDHLVVPNWPKIARDIDVVHLTMAGLVSIQFARIQIDRDVTTMSGWDVESACWLRPRVQRWVPIQPAEPQS